MSKPFLFIILLIFLPFIAVSQTAIKGVVYDKTSKKPLSGAIVSVLDEKSETITYDISSEKGEYRLLFNNADKKILLTGRILGYKEEQIELENKSQQQNLYLEETGIEIKEVTIKSKPINVNEDTLKYSVNTFKSAGDRVIGDVLKKLPGIEVTESGGIKYNGEPINKFYIEGLDLLESKYGIATNNVPVDAVQNVEVIENHQPIKSLKGMISSAQAAINLKLKDNKMARPVGGVRAGGGYSDEVNWLLEIFALQASKKRQTIVMYKTNNTGNDITQEFNEQTISIRDLQNSDDEFQKEILSPSGINNPPIEKERYLFNKTHTASLNNLWKTGEDNQLRVNVNYVNDVETQNTYSQSDYYLGDSVLQVTETDNYTQKQQQLDGGISYNENGKGHYLDDDLKWKIKWNKNNSNSVINGSEIGQSFEMPVTQIQNQLNYLKVFGEKIFNIGSYLSFINQPENLTVDNNGVFSYQKIKLSNFYSKTSSYYSWGWRRSSLRLNGDLEASANNIYTDLDNTLFTDSLQCNKQINIINVELSPLYSYKTDKINFEIEFPINNEVIFKTDKLKNNEKTTDNYFLLNSRVGFSYKFNPFLSFRASYRFAQNIGDYTDYLDAFIMKNYLSYYKPSGILSLRKNQSYSLSINYKNPLSSLFINSYISYVPSETNKSIATRFVELQSVKSDINLRNKTNMWMGNIYLGKYISKIKTNFSITTNYSYYQSSQVQQNILYPFHSNMLSVNFKSNTKVSDFLTFVYLLNFMNNQSTITTSGIKNTSNLNQFGQQFKTYYSPTKKLEFNLQLEQSYNELSTNSFINMFFANMGATYKLKKIDFEFNWNNIFNKKEYAYSAFSGLDTYRYKYGIRPMSVMFTVSFKF
ncbi:conserved hypothetical protein [uncultured Paludibacter sp.]|uniref:TonB-dependent receptor n=1 Tax=uncultured Paludibacter sp. TaxID=497635 RepID=A0A653AEI5_9BACT|nr:conserved hypothetical protein [uncultured Paludibacter sp.]